MPKKFERVMHMNQHGWSRIYNDRIVTYDADTNGKVITDRNRITGETHTIKSGKCREAILDLHANIVTSKWKRPTEGDFLGHVLKP